MRFREHWIDGAWALFAVTSVFSITLSQTAIGLLVLGWLVRGGWSGSRGLRLPLIPPFASFLALSALSALLSARPAQALSALDTEWLPLALCVVALDTTRNRERPLRLLRWWFAAGALSALLGLVQYLAPGPLHLALIGSGFRVRGTVGHYMTLSGLLMLVVLMALSLLLHRRQRRRELWLAGALLLLLAALMLTQVRSAWIGLSLGVVYVLWRRRRSWLWLAPLAALALLALGPPSVRDRAASLLDPRNATIVERVYFWRAAVDIIADHPWRGVGPEQVAAAYEAHRLPDDPKQPWNPFTHLHSTPLQIAAERGLPALAAWVWIWVAFFVHAARVRRRLDPRDERGRALIVGAVGCVSAFLVAGLFECNHADSEVMQLVGAILALPFVVRDTAGSAPDGVPAKLV